MELIRVDTQRAYERIRQMITTLDLAPGIAIDEGNLAEELDIGLVPIREALKLLIHDNLVEVSSRGGIFVAGVSIPELEQISELRRLLESFCARQAAQRATPDDIVILEALRQEQATIPPEDSQRWFDLDHKFHQAIARAAHNKYLAQTLDHFFGLSQRLWYLALPHLARFLRQSQRNLGSKRLECLPPRRQECKGLKTVGAPLSPSALIVSRGVTHY
ncbi:MAG: GntR family transcriptional regulator [Anaerolineales bacterium]